MLDIIYDETSKILHRRVENLKNIYTQLNRASTKKNGRYLKSQIAILRDSNITMTVRISDKFRRKNKIRIKYDTDGEGNYYHKNAIDIKYVDVMFNSGFIKF